MSADARTGLSQAGQRLVFYALLVARLRNWAAESGLGYGPSTLPNLRNEKVKDGIWIVDYREMKDQLSGQLEGDHSLQGSGECALVAMWLSEFSTPSPPNISAKPSWVAAEIGRARSNISAS